MPCFEPLWYCKYNNSFLISLATDCEEDMEMVSGRSPAKNVSIPCPIRCFYSPDFPLNVCCSSLPRSQHVWDVFSWPAGVDLKSESTLPALHIQRLHTHTWKTGRFWIEIDIDISFFKKKEHRSHLSGFGPCQNDYCMSHCILCWGVWSFACLALSSLQRARYAQALRLESDPYDRCLPFMAFDSIA